MHSVDPGLSLRALARQLLPEETPVDSVARVEGRHMTTDTTFTSLENVMDSTMHDLKQMGTSSIKFFVRYEPDSPPRVNASDPLMAAERQRSSRF